MFSLPSAPCILPTAMKRRDTLQEDPKHQVWFANCASAFPRGKRSWSVESGTIRDVESLLLPRAQRRLRPQLLPCFHMAWATRRQCCVPSSCLLHSGCSSPWKPAQMRHFVVGSLSCCSWLNACISLLWSGTFSVAGFLVFHETSRVPCFTHGVMFLSRAGYQSVSGPAAASRADPFCNAVLSWLWALPG